MFHNYILNPSISERFSCFNLLFELIFALFSEVKYLEKMQWAAFWFHTNAVVFADVSTYMLLYLLIYSDKGRSKGIEHGG